MWVWPQLAFGGSPPSPIAIGGPFPQAKALLSRPLPPSSPRPSWLFLQCSGRGRPRLVGEGSLGRGVVEGQGPPSGTWGQTHIWGHSILGPLRPSVRHPTTSLRCLRECPDLFLFAPFSSDCQTLLQVTDNWKRLKGQNPEGKNFRKLLRRKQSSAKISKISRNTIKSSKSDIFYLPRNLLNYLLRTFFSSAKFSEVFTLCIFTLWLFPRQECPRASPGRFRPHGPRSVRNNLNQ